MTFVISTDSIKSIFEKYPDSVTFAHLAAKLIEEGDYQKAVEICQSGLQKHSHYAFGHFVLGNAYYHIKNYTDAKRELEKALAYDPNNPKAWEILSAINEILNLGEDAKESNIQAYLIDFFKAEASPNFLPTADTPAFEWKSETAELENLSADTTDISTDEMDQEKIGEMLGEVVTPDQEGYDFEKALTEVFQGKEVETTSTAPIDEVPSDVLTELEPPAEGSDQDSVISAQEFTSEIESFFSSYEEKEKLPEVRVEQPPAVEKAGPPALEEFELPEEAASKTEEESATPGEPLGASEKKLADELLDFKSFITDIIKDQDEVASKESVGSDIPQPQISTKAEEFLKEEDFNLPEPVAEPPAPASPIAKVDNIEDLTPKEKRPVSRKATLKVSKPPILSPTLGEIYIAQGRFEEAIEVFKQLLQKDPQNARFRRKIEDLQKILAKKNLGA
jgi:tetratricopeptide (TPR) repeat protein